MKNGHKGVRAYVALCEFKVCVSGIFPIKKKKLRKVWEKVASAEFRGSNGTETRHVGSDQKWLSLLLNYESACERERGGKGFGEVSEIKSDCYYVV